MNLIFKTQGRMSTFGGPHDTGVGPHEGLALIEERDLAEWWFARLFLRTQPDGTTGLARRLNPLAFYIAMRWGDREVGRETARRAIFKLTNPLTERHVFAQAADFGPAVRVKRLVDVSPGVAGELNLETDDIITVEMIT